jgi:GDP-L-fucose synthase
MHMLDRAKAKIYVAGHTGLVGSAVVRRLTQLGYRHILVKPRRELDLLDQSAVHSYLRQEKPDIVIDAAAKVGGIHANSTYRTEFLYDNLQIQNNLIWGSHLAGVDNFVFLGSSCIYPKIAPQPMNEMCLLSDTLEPTNRPYALAKIAGLELIGALRYQYGRNYFSIMPTNLYGPGDNFHPENSHVIPALMRRIHEAKVRGDKEVVIWGTGRPMREFLYVDDCAEAIVFLAENVDRQTFNGNPMVGQHWAHINLGSGDEYSIADLARKICETVGFNGRLVFDPTKPDGTPRKLLDVSFLHSLGWTHTTSLSDGLRRTYAQYVTTDQPKFSEGNGAAGRKMTAKPRDTRRLDL